MRKPKKSQRQQRNPRQKNPGNSAAEWRLADLDMRIAGIKEYMATSRARKLIPILKRSSYHKGEVYDLTPRQYRELMGREPRKAVMRRGKIPWEYSLDQLATELGYRDGETLKEAIEDVAARNLELEKLERERRSLMVELGEKMPKKKVATKRRPVPAARSKAKPRQAAVTFAKKRIAVDGKVSVHQVTRGKDTLGYIVAFPPSYGIYPSKNGGLDIRREALAGATSIKKAKDLAKTRLGR